MRDCRDSRWPCCAVCTLHRVSLCIQYQRGPGDLVLLKYVDNSGTVGSLASFAKLLEDDGERYGTVGVESDLFFFGRSMGPQILKRLRDVH